MWLSPAASLAQNCTTDLLAHADDGVDPATVARFSDAAARAIARFTPCEVQRRAPAACGDPLRRSCAFQGTSSDVVLAFRLSRVGADVVVNGALFERGERLRTERTEDSFTDATSAARSGQKSVRALLDRPLRQGPSYPLLFGGGVLFGASVITMAASITVALLAEAFLQDPLASTDTKDRAIAAGQAAIVVGLVGSGVSVVGAALLGLAFVE